MLLGIPKILSPELLRILSEMGHGDELVLADGNFPGEALGRRCVRADGHGTLALLEAILQVFPLDVYAQPTYIMEKVPGDPVATPIWDEYRRVLAPYTKSELGTIERFAFYERAKNAYAVIMSGESALYANLILKKGVVTD